MADRFDKFTERARKVLQLAQEEAQRFNHNYIGTEHLLLGLVREGEGVAAKVLANLGVELNKVRSAVEFIIGRGDRTVTGDIGLTPRAKKVIELSVDEARRLNHHYIGTEHLLLGLVREGEGIAAGVLESLGVSHRADHRPDALSGGEQQRVAIARALLFSPPVILADEPTGALDSRNSEALWRLLADISRQHETTIIMVTHEPAAAAHCRRVFVLADGRIAGHFDTEGLDAASLATCYQRLARA